jgi:hypothetical protein
LPIVQHHALQSSFYDQLQSARFNPNSPASVSRHLFPSPPFFIMAMEVLHVMTPEEWGKPIDVDEKWIHFVDENVKASKLTTADSMRP